MRKGTLIGAGIVFLLVLSSFAGAVTIRKITDEESKEKNMSVTSDPPKGVGGWHAETSLQTHGKDFDDIEKIGGNEGGWEVPYETYAVRLWADHNRVKASYIFDINEGPVRYVNYQIEYKDVGWLSDGPDALISKWDGTWESFPNIGGAGEDNDDYEWESHTFDAYANQYVNSQGQICVAAQAWDDSSIIHQDNLAVKTMKISYEAADEEIYNVDLTKYDSDDDGAVDSVKIDIDVDVADDGDGTQTTVTAKCNLRDPTGSIINSDQETWTITDHQVELGTVHVSSLGGENGDYTLEIEVYDKFGNLEDEQSETIYLVPDPKRILDFYVDPYYGGSIQIEGYTFLDNESVLVSDDEYSISAVPEEYFSFQRWECTGGMSVADSNSNETTLTVNDNGTVKAVFGFMLNTLYFYVSPDFAGYILIEEYDFVNDTGCYIDEGTYNLTAVSVEDAYYFYYWYLEGDITVEDEYSSQTVLTVAGDGMIYAVFNENTPPEKPEMPDGPLSGGVYERYTYSTTTTDADGDQMYYLFDWDDGTDSGWIGPYDSGEEAGTSHVWTGSRTYQVKVRAKDQFGAISDWSDPISVGIHSPPNTPIVKGPSNGVINTEYEFTISATDPDSDNVYFYIEWGDGDIEDWIGPYTSGEEVKVTHAFSKKGTFTVKVLAKDENDIVSQQWGMLVVEMPKAKLFQFRIFEFLQEKLLALKLFQRFEFLRFLK